MENKQFVGYIFILVAIGCFVASLVLSFFTYRFLTLQIVFPSNLPTIISRSILFIGLILAFIIMCVGLFLIIKFR